MSSVIQFLILFFYLMPKKRMSVSLPTGSALLPSRDELEKGLKPRGTPRVLVYSKTLSSWNGRPSFRYQIPSDEIEEIDDEEYERDDEEDEEDEEYEDEDEEPVDVRCCQMGQNKKRANVDVVNFKWKVKRRMDTTGRSSEAQKPNSDAYDEWVRFQRTQARRGVFVPSTTPAVGSHAASNPRRINLRSLRDTLVSIHTERVVRDLCNIENWSSGRVNVELAITKTMATKVVENVLEHFSQQEEPIRILLYTLKDEDNKSGANITWKGGVCGEFTF